MATTITIDGERTRANIIIGSEGASITDTTPATPATPAIPATLFLGIPFYDGSAATGVVSSFVTFIQYLTFSSEADASAAAIDLSPDASDAIPSNVRWEVYRHDLTVHIIRTFQRWDQYSSAADNLAILATDTSYSSMLSSIKKYHEVIAVNENDVQKTRTKAWTSNLRAFSKLTDLSNGGITLDVFGFSGGYYQKPPSGPPKFDPSGYKIDPSGSFTITEIFYCASSKKAEDHCTFLSGVASNSVGVSGQPVLWELGTNDNVCYCYQLWESAEDWIIARNQFTGLGLTGISTHFSSLLTNVLTVEINMYSTPIMESPVTTAMDNFLTLARSDGAIATGFPNFIVSFDGELCDGGAIYSYN